MNEVIAPTARRSTRWLLLCLAAGLATALFAAPASARIAGHSYSTSFGGSGTNALGSPAGVAVDNETGDIYVTDEANHRVEKFDSAGNFLLMFGKGVNAGTGDPDVCTDAGAPTDICQAGAATAGGGGFIGPTWAAVDNSIGASRGDIYVADREYGSPVQKFDSSGNLITSWGESGQLFAGAYPFEEVAGIAVDAHGHLYVMDYFGDVYRFNQKGEYEEYREDFNGIPLHYGPSPGATIDSREQFYYGYWENEGVLKYAPFSEQLPGFEASRHKFLGEVTGTEYEQATTGLAADAFGNDELYVDNHGTHVESYEATCNASCTPVQTFGTGHLTEGKGVAVDPDSHDVYVADAAAGKIAVFAPVIFPDVRAMPTSGVGPSSVTLNGHVDPAGGPGVTSCQFEYVSDSVRRMTVVGATGGTYMLSFEGKPVKEEEKLPEEEELKSTASAAEVEEAIGAGRVTVSGPDGGPYLIQFIGSSIHKADQLGVARNHLQGATAHLTIERDWADLQTAACTPEASSGAPITAPTDVHAELQGLTLGNPYVYRLVAASENGSTTGPERLAEAQPLPPVIDGTSSSNVHPAQATLEARINPNLGATVYRFQYGLTSAYGEQTYPSNSIGEDETDHPVSTEVTGLAPGTTYHYRAVATNMGGTVTGPDMTFTTPAPPAVLQESSSAIGQDVATLGAQVNPNLLATTYHFEYGTTTAYGISTSESPTIGADELSHAATAALTGLAPGTTYHFRVVATNEAGSSAGPDQTFTTGPAQSSEEEPKPPPKTKPCKRGFVKKHGKCVKKRHHKRRHHHA